jgi:hypothetical protein
VAGRFRTSWRRRLARALATALDLKGHSHYGTFKVGATELRRLTRAAEVLVSAALEVLVSDETEVI